MGHAAMRLTRASELADAVGGLLIGPDRAFSGVAPLDAAGPTDAAYAVGAVSADCAAGVLIVRGPLPDRTCVVVADPKLAFVQLLELRFPEVHPPGVHPGAHVHPTAQLGLGVVVYPGVWIGPRCVVGDGAVLFPNAVLYADTIVGAGARVHAGAVLGADGFSYHPTRDGPRKVPQIGRVRVGRDVEIGANSCVDRAFLEETVIGDDCKLDNLVQVGHNTELGQGVVIAGQAGLSGSVKVGDGVLLAGQVGVADHSRIGAGAQVGAQSGVRGRLSAGQRYFGSPAMPIGLALRVAATLKRLPELIRRVDGLERRLGRVEDER